MVRLDNDDPRTATITFSIFSTSREEAMSCLDFLVGLPDTNFKQWQLPEL
jgi:hypothetical protein